MAGSYSRSPGLTTPTIRWRPLIAAALLIGAGAPSVVAQGRVNVAAAAAAIDPQALNTVSEHYTATASAAGAVGHVQIYNAPVGYPTTAGWSLVNNQLQPAVAGIGAEPGQAPFKLNVALAGTSSQIASLTTEDGGQLSLGTSPTGAGVQPATNGQLSGDSVSYGAGQLLGNNTGLAVRSTVSGLDVHIVLQGPTSPSQITLSLTPDRKTSLTTRSDGSIVGQRRVTSHATDNTAYGYDQPEYILGLPIVRDSSADPAASQFTGPVAMTLAPQGAAIIDTTGVASPSPRQVTLAVDTTWLHAPARAYPISIDLPVSTALSVQYSGTMGTVSSCMPDRPAVQARVLVGTSAGCTFQGQAYFDVRGFASMAPQPQIQTATLNLYTPGQSGPTALAIYPNSPKGYASRTSLPTWASAAGLALSAQGIAQSGSDGHWQHFDVSGLMRQWVGNSSTNNGLTLVNPGTSLTIASPLWVGEDSPQFAPYLDVTYAQPASAPAFHEYQPAPAGATPDAGGITPNFSDGVASIYGLSGQTTPDEQCVQGATVCSDGNIRTGQAAALGAHCIRIRAQLSCTTYAPGAAYWANQSVYLLLNDAYRLHITPVVQFVQDYGIDQVNPPLKIQCPPATSPNLLAANIQDFAQTVAAHTSLPYNFLVYYEIGNEMNGHTDYADYTSFFAEGAQALHQFLPPAFQNFRALTGGLLNPDPSPNYAQGCAVTGGGERTAQYAADAIYAAEGQPFNVPEANLGLSIHPYGYTTNQPYYWYNYKGKYGQTTSTCTDLYQTLANWRTYPGFSNLPIFLSETNWSSDPKATVQCIPQPQSPPGCSIVEYGLESSYLVDQFTWFFDRGYIGAGGSIRVMWYHGADGVQSGDRAPGGGLYLTSGSPKVFFPSPTGYPGADTGLVRCPKDPSLLQPVADMPTAYGFLAHYYTGSGGACYDSHGN